MNTALLYIKPHAATEKAKALVERELKSIGLSVVSDGTMQTNDIKTNPNIVRFNPEVMRPDSHIYYYVVQWSETNMSWHTVQGLIGETNTQGVRGKIRSAWRELALEEEPKGVNDSLYFSDGALSGLADRIEWLGAIIEVDETGLAIAADGPQLLAEAKNWVRNVSVNGKPAMTLCRGYNTSELINAIRKYLPARRAPLQVTATRELVASVPADSTRQFVDDDFPHTGGPWMRIKDVLRSNPATIVPKCPCAEQISPAPGLNNSIATAFVNLAWFGRDAIDRVFISKSVRTDGYYVLQLFRDAAWQEVVIDDAVPVVDDKPAYIHSERGQWWPLLLYKALAKFYGSYQALNSVTYLEAMHVITGKPVFVQYFRSYKDKDGHDIMPGTGYYGDPIATASNFWKRVSNDALKRGSLIVLRVASGIEGTYGLLPGSSLTIAAGVMINEELVFKVYSPGHSYTGRYGPGSAELADPENREKMLYEDSEARCYFFIPLATVCQICEYLVVARMAVDEPLVLQGPWERKTGLPGSTYFRRGYAIRMKNTTGSDVKVTVVVKQVHESGETVKVGLCALRPRDSTKAQTALLTDDAYVVVANSVLRPNNVALPIFLGPRHSLTLVPVCQPVPQGDFVILAYTSNNSSRSIALSQVKSIVDTAYSIDYSAVLHAPFGKSQRIMQFHLKEDSNVAVLAKRIDERKTIDVEGYQSLAIYRSNTSDVVAIMDKSFATAEVTISAPLTKGSYDVAVGLSYEDVAEQPTDVPLRLSVFADPSSGVTVSDYRNIEAERLNDARYRATHGDQAQDVATRGINEEGQQLPVKQRLFTVGEWEILHDDVEAMRRRHTVNVSEL